MSDYCCSYRRFYTGMALEAFGSLTEPAEVQVVIKFYTSRISNQIKYPHSYFYGINDVMSFLKRAKFHSPIIERAPRLDLCEIHPWDKYICRKQEFISHNQLDTAVQLTWKDPFFQTQFMKSLICFPEMQFLDICANGRHFVNGIVPTDIFKAETIVEEARNNCRSCANGEPAINEEILSGRMK